MDALILKEVSIVYDDPTGSGGRLEAVHNLSFSLAKGKIGCLLGPSGCGKTSILRAIAGFIGVSAGEIWLNGLQIVGPGLLVAPEKRSVGVVFQDYALFPHLSVAENIAFGLTQGRRLKPGQLPQEALEMIELVGLAGQADR